MKLFMVFDEAEAQIIGLYTTREKAEKRREKVIDDHTRQWFFKEDWYDPNSVEIIEVETDKDLVW